MKRKEIVYVQPNAKLGGSFQSLYYLLQKIDKAKYRPTVLFPIRNNILIKKLEAIGVKSVVSAFPPVGYSVNFKYRLLVTDFIRLCVLKEYYIRKMPNLSADLIHLNSLNSVFGFFIARRLGVPVIWHVREQLPPVFHGLVRKYFLTLFRDNIVKNIVCISENESKDLPAEKVRIIHNFYRLERQPVDTHKPTKFISIGSFTTDKGFWLLIDAVRRLSVKYTPEDFKIFLMGISPSRTITKRILREKAEEHFRTEIRQHQIQAYFEIYQQRIQIHPDFFSDFHVLIRPSLHQDPWGRDIIEAMSTGRAIIATGSYPKFVRDGFNGYLVRCSDPVALARRIEEFIEDDQLIRKFGQNSFLLAKELFDPLENTRQIERIYDRVLG
jgi:glycosyltransferase involved in cell wall biosynthesis